MKLLEWLARMWTTKPAEPDLVHPVFGPLQADVAGSRDDNWLTLEDVEFSPLDTRICIMINAGAAGPSEEQVAFYRTLQDTDQSILASVEPVLRSELQKWVRVPLGESLRDHVHLTGLTIPHGGDSSQPWDISFEAVEEESGHLFTVYFENGKPSWVSVDG